MKSGVTEKRKRLSYKKIATVLWNLLDNIDTIDDIAKENNVMYRHLVQDMQSRKNNYGVSDGYNIHWLRDDINENS